MQTRYVLILMTALVLTACGSAQPTTGPAPTDVPAVSTASAATAAPATATGETTEMGHGNSHGTMADSEAPYDAQFIDSMIIHHQGAIDMANQVLQQGERSELKALAEDIISAQTAEIAQLREWRAAWYPDLPETEGMGMAMGDMVIEGDAARPFDQRFIEAMIAHHEGAIAMAKDAKQHAEHQEIRDLAQTIILAQEGEIVQMRAWQQTWFAQ